jgi:arylsulfatase A
VATSRPDGRSAGGHRSQPNFVVVLCDDLGYGDLGPYGGSIPTPAVDRMAREGLIATDYYAPANICTPSRAAMLTGRYPVRTGLGYEVIHPGDDRRLPLSEVTIAGALKPDYVSGLFGKWHLGQIGADWDPTNYGFETYFGIPYSHDMAPLSVYHVDMSTGESSSASPELANLQQQFYTHAERFIERHRDRPFYVQLSLSSPHLPCYPNEAFNGVSEAGPFGDVVVEIDSIVGRLLDKLRELNLDQDTIVILTSDNGPWFEGSTGPLRDRKGGAGYDGGYRVPFIVWAPGRVATGGKSDAILSGIDLLPTFCALAGVPVPAGVQFDGQDISAVLLEGAPSPHDEVLLFDNEDIVGVRTQRWKYVTEAHYRQMRFKLEERGYVGLFDMQRDISESYSIAATYPEVAQEMAQRLERAKATFAPFVGGMPEFFKRRARERLARLD